MSCVSCAVGSGGTQSFRTRKRSCPRGGKLYGTVERLPGLHPGSGRGADRIPADIQHRSPDHRRRSAGLRRRTCAGFQHHHPAGRHPGGGLGVSRQDHRDHPRPAEPAAGAALHRQPADRLLPGGGARRRLRRRDPPLPVQPGHRGRRAGGGRTGHALGRAAHARHPRRTR
ncbi:hypothetical protein D3C81_1788460 [compost metagenome]